MKKIINSKYFMVSCMLSVITYGFIKSILISIYDEHTTESYLSTVDFERLSLSITILAITAFGMIRDKWKLSDIGFTLNKKTYINIILIILMTLLVSLDSNIHKVEYLNINFPLHILYASSEELLFRALLINQLILLLGNSKKKIFFAILISSIIFTIIHIPIKDIQALFNIFFFSMAFGYAYNYTKSILFPIFSHVLGNTMAMSGFWGGGISIVVYLILALLSKFKKR